MALDNEKLALIEVRYHRRSHFSLAMASVPSAAEAVDDISNIYGLSFGLLQSILSF